MIELFERILTSDPQQGREQRVYGVVTARVRENRGDGTFILDYLSMGDGEPSAPARVALPMAGENRGTYFMPEVDDEVIVAFELGDMNRPIILGGVYNARSPAPEQARESPENNVRTIVSRSGHEITLDDERGAEKVKIRSQHGHEIVLDDTLPGKITVSTAGGQKIEMNDAGGLVKVESLVNLELRSATITLAANSIQFSGGGGVSVEAGLGTLRITAPVQIQLTSAGILLRTTNIPTASMVVIDGSAYGAHTHSGVTTGPGISGPVAT